MNHTAAATKITTAGHPLPHHTPNQNPRTITPFTLNTNDGPLVGLSYFNDYRYEEEHGSTQIAELLNDTLHPNNPLRSLTATNRPYNQGDLVHVTDTHLAISTHPWSSDYLDPTLTAAMRDLEIEDDYVTGIHIDRWLKVPELRTHAKELGIPNTGRLTKPQLTAAIRDHLTHNPPHPNMHAAWFRTGETLVIPRGVEGSAFRIVTDHLVTAADEGFLMAGNGLVQVFGSGLTLIDSRDLSDNTVHDLVAARAAAGVQ